MTRSLLTIIWFEALEAPHVPDTPIARSIVVSKLDTVRNAWVMGIGTSALNAVSEDPNCIWPCPSRVPEAPSWLQNPSHSIHHGQLVGDVPVVIVEDRAMSPVIVPARVPNQKPRFNAAPVRDE